MIFDKTFLDPKYNGLEKYVQIMYKGFWTPAKYEQLIKQVDAPHYFNLMDEVDQECVKRCILAVAMVEDKVKMYWSTLAQDLPQTIIGDVGGLFAQSEVTHRRSYHSLLEALKINIGEINNHQVLKDRIAYLTKYLEKDSKVTGKRRVLKKLVLFTSLVEKCSLFTQFYILMSYAKSNKGLKTISSLQQSTAIEENIHYEFGIDLINIIKEEYPTLWNDYLAELVEKNIKMAYKSEVELLTWIFEKGTPEHLNVDEVVNFLNSNFNKVCSDLGLDLKYHVSDQTYLNKNQWFDIKTKAPTEPDFFDSPVGGYSSQETDIDINTLNF